MIAEKILNLIEDKGSAISDTNAVKIRELLSSDEVIAKEIPVKQVGSNFSIAVLVLGLLSLAACLYMISNLNESGDINPFETLEVSSVVAWLATTTILLCQTSCLQSSSKPESDNKEQQNDPMNSGPDDVRARLHSKLSHVDCD